MHKNFLFHFIVFGCLGWIIECIWTGIQSILAGNLSMLCKTSLWMFPIYGLTALFVPLCQRLQHIPIFLRGLLYMCIIFFVEYCTGSFLRHFQIYPWQYTNTKYQIQGVIRLDYAPLWFSLGLCFEFVSNYLHQHKSL
ncbi:MAG: hypothetical protein II073_05760 [Lachnospiraceae bacterium]|nr:hypothetical protein [Lachnospiraceae bacterium]